MDAKTPTCATCAHYSPPDPRDRHAVPGFGVCAQLPAGHYRAPAAACRFDPSAYRPATPRRKRGRA